MKENQGHKDKVSDAISLGGNIVSHPRFQRTSGDVKVSSEEQTKAPDFEEILADALFELTPDERKDYAAHDIAVRLEKDENGAFVHVGSWDGRRWKAGYSESLEKEKMTMVVLLDLIRKAINRQKYWGKSQK